MAEPDALIRLAWQELTAAVVTAGHPWRTPILVTGGSQADGRVVVLREFSSEPASLLFYTDVRSPKIRAIREDARVVWIFYHPEMRLQVRVRADAMISHNDSTTRRDWVDIPPASRREYAACAGPGSDWEDVELLSDEDAERNFAVVRTVPRCWDVLQLDPQGHRRIRWSPEATTRLVP